jgi:hypothetical protein
MVFCLHVAHGICGQSPQAQLTAILRSEIVSGTFVGMAHFFYHHVYFQATAKVK